MSKKKYVTYAPYHVEHLLYPCSFRDTDYTCCNTDAPQYGRVCYKHYRCHYNCYDPYLKKKYKESQAKRAEQLAELNKKYPPKKKAISQPILHKKDHVIFSATLEPPAKCPICLTRMFCGPRSFILYSDEKRTTEEKVISLKVFTCDHCGLYWMRTRDADIARTSIRDYGLVIVPDHKEKMELYLDTFKKLHGNKESKPTP